MDERTVSLAIDVAGKQAAFGLVHVPADAVARHGAFMFREFAERSSAHGLAMSKQEIREACWAPLAARLAQMSDKPFIDHSAAEKTFAQRAFAFLVFAAFGDVKPGEQFVLEVSRGGEVGLFRRPHRLLGRNRHRFGNYRAAMPASAGGALGEAV